ncbi:hypothetical protein ACFTY7_24960 [Streptomyces sp. NPDC057062]|uniref:hypothetical protein n=1 Tax=Streptomyces sp. NPDC057062 TaxID=3346011 RepID=UPI00363EE40A
MNGFVSHGPGQSAWEKVPDSTIEEARGGLFGRAAQTRALEAVLGEAQAEIAVPAAC